MKLISSAIGLAIFVLLGAGCYNSATGSVALYHDDQTAQIVTNTNANDRGENANAVVDSSTMVTISLTPTGPLPSSLTVTVGAAVLFVNNDTKQHQVASTPAASSSAPTFDSATPLPPGGTFRVTLRSAGTITYSDPRRSTRPSTAEQLWYNNPMKHPIPPIFLTADHGGVKLKKYLLRKLHQSGYGGDDLGAYKIQRTDDYPDYAKKLAAQVRKSPGSIGIAICRTGVGMAISANRLKGIRAINAWNTNVAKQARHDERANVLALGADYIPPVEAWNIVLAFLREPYQPAVRYQRRIRKLDA